MSKSKDAGAASIILNYLNVKNRPYSAQDVFGNLQKQHGLGKTAVVKAMELLAQQGKIREKVYGKQKIYFADQSQFTDVSDTELKSMDGKISELNSQIQGVQQDCRQLDAELRGLNSSMTTKELISEIEELKKECVESKQRLERIKNATNHVTPEEKEKVYKERSQFVREWKKRKRLTNDIMDAVLEGYPKSKKQFLEEVGIETDEDCKVTVPNV
ncbi:homologous-pairing protein 2-like protein isoform X1 [Huso huso]|uniref:Homologous-pairing protein 2 homolog n=1 Tax=Huso huso TaxID=61971 RepID=A0ABR0YCI9_HUSHU